MKFISSLTLLCSLNFAPGIDELNDYALAPLASFCGSKDARALACVNRHLAEQMKPVMKFADEHTDPFVLALQDLKGVIITNNTCSTHRGLVFKFNDHVYKVVLKMTPSENMNFINILTKSIRQEWSIDLEFSKAPRYDGFRIFSKGATCTLSDILRGLEILRAEFENNLTELQIKVGDEYFLRLGKENKIKALVKQILPGIGLDRCTVYYPGDRPYIMDRLNNFARSEMSKPKLESGRIDFAGHFSVQLTSFIT